MIHNIYAMKDNLVGYGRPHIGLNNEVECRDFKAAMSQDYASEDKSLWLIGKFNDETGEINGISHIKIMEGKPHERNEI